MPTPAVVETRISLIRSEAERLAAGWRGFSPEQWGRPTACDLWSAAEVAAHLVWIGEFYVIFAGNALRGDLTPPPGSPKDPQYADLPPEEFYDRKAAEYRRKLGVAGLEPAFTRYFGELVEVLSRMTPADYEKPCFYHSGNRPLGTLADLAVQELAIHAWDIQWGQEGAAQLSPEGQPVLLERVVQRPQPVIPLPAAALPARVRFALSGAVSAAYDLDLTAAATGIEPAGDAVADVMVHCTAEDFILLLYRRLNLPQVMAAGQISVSGDAELAQQFADNF